MGSASLSRFGANGCPANMFLDQDGDHVDDPTFFSPTNSIEGALVFLSDTNGGRTFTCLCDHSYGSLPYGRSVVKDKSIKAFHNLPRSTGSVVDVRVLREAAGELRAADRTVLSLRQTYADMGDGLAESAEWWGSGKVLLFFVCVLRDTLLIEGPTPGPRARRTTQGRVQPPRKKHSNRSGRPGVDR